MPARLGRPSPDLEQQLEAEVILQSGGVSKPDTPLSPFSGTPSSPAPHIEPPAGAQARAISVLILLVTVGALFFLPVRIIGIGFRPLDDARRHVAKVFADRPWDEILVLRAEATVDSHPGWHAVLGAAHRAGIETPDGLLVVSSLSLALLFLLTPVALGLGRPESWLLALLVTAVGTTEPFHRVLLGRPFIVAMSALLVLAIVWPRLRADRLPRGTWCALTTVFALAVWIHGSWYLWALPLAAFVVAGELRAARRIALALALGSVIAALATGSPWAFLLQAVQHPFWALVSDLPRRVLVGEFQPSDGDPWMVTVVVAMIAWRGQRGRSLAALRHDPVFLIALGGWILGFQTQRFWLDWGMPACLVWTAREIDDGLTPLPRSSRSRLLLVTVVGATLCLAVTNDREGRWSSHLNAPFLSLDNPAHRPWLPERGGIVYSNDMKTFYNTFWKNPRAEWRYLLGFEPALMPPADLAVFRQIQLHYSRDGSFAPWVAKLRPQDRLIIVREQTTMPKIPRLEWHSPYRGMWIGRPPKSVRDATPAAATSLPGDETATDSAAD